MCTLKKSPWREPRPSIRTKIFEGCFQPNFVDSKQLPIYFPYFTSIFTCIKGVAKTEFCITSSMIKKWRKQRWLLEDLKTILEIVKPKCGEKLNQHCTSSNVSESFPAHRIHILGIWTYRPLLWNEPIDHIIPIFNFPDPYRH